MVLHQSSIMWYLTLIHPFSCNISNSLPQARWVNLVAAFLSPCFLRSWCSKAEPTCWTNCAEFGHQRRCRSFICSVASEFFGICFTFEKDEEGGNDLLSRSPGQLTQSHRTCWPGGISTPGSGPCRANPMTPRDCPTHCCARMPLWMILLKWVGPGKIFLCYKNFMGRRFLIL